MKYNPVENWRAKNAITRGPVDNLLYNSDGTINPKGIFMALVIVGAAVGGGLVYAKKDEITSFLAPYFGKYIELHEKYPRNLTNISHDVPADKKTIKENITEPFADPYDSIKDILDEVPFLKKNGTLTVKNQYNRSIKDYLTSLLNDPAFVEGAQKYITGKQHKKSEELMNLSFSKFGETNFYNLPQIGNISFYHPPHYNITKMNLTKYGFSEDEQKGIYAFHFKPGRISDMASSETEQELVSPEEAYARILNLTKKHQKLKTVGNNFDLNRRNFAAVVPNNVAVMSEFYTPNEEIFVLSNGTLSYQKRESIFSKFRPKGGGDGKSIGVTGTEITDSASPG